MEEDMVILLVLLLIGFLFLGALLGMIGFFKTNKLEKELRLLRTFEPPKNKTQPVKQAKPVQSKTPPQQSQPLKPVTQAKPAPRSEPAKPAKSSLGLTDRIEQTLRGNWLIWVAGIALAFGGIFIVQYAAEAGLLGPKTRVFFAILAGVMMLGFAHFLRKKTPTSTALANSIAPPILAGAGLITLYGAVYASFALYQFIGAGIAFALLAAIAGFALYQALLFGPLIAVFGLVGAFVTPALIGSPEPSAARLFAYTFVVSVGGLGLARLRPWRWNAILALLGGLLWPVVWLILPNGTEQLWVLQIYLPALAAVTTIFAWGQAEQAFDWQGPNRSPMSMFTTIAATFGAGLLLFWVVANSSHDMPSVLALAGLGAFTLFVSWKREGFAPNVPIMAAFGALVLLSWPMGQTALVDAPEQLGRFLGQLNAPFTGPPFLPVCFAFAALFGFGGYLASLGHKRRAILVATSVMFPSLVLFIAYWRITGMQADWPFALAALALALTVLALLELESRVDPAFEKHPGAAAALALGVSGAVFLIFLTLFSQMWLSLALAGQALVAAFLWRRFSLISLQWTAMALALAASLRLVFWGEAFDMQIGQMPIFNSLLIGFGGSATALFAAIWLFQKGGVASKSAVVQSLYAAAISITITLLSLQLHHLMSGGDLNQDLGFAEMGLQVSMYGAIALLLRWRLGPELAFSPKWTERVVAFFSLAGFLLIVLPANPWWGFDTQEIKGGFLINSLTLAFLLPMIIYAAYGYFLQKQAKPKLARFVMLMSALGGFLWVTLEVRRSFHGADLTIGRVLDGERYAYSASWLALALFALGFGFWRKSGAFRLGGLILLAIVSIKVFVFDLADLSGLLRGLSFLGLGASLMGIGLLYQRLGAQTNAKEEA